MLARGRGGGRGRRGGARKTAVQATASGGRPVDQGESRTAADQEEGGEVPVTDQEHAEAELHAQGRKEVDNEAHAGEDCEEGLGEEPEEHEMEGEAEGIYSTGEGGEFEEMEEPFEAGDEEYYGDAADDISLGLEQFVETDQQAEEGLAEVGEPEEQNEDFDEELFNFGEVIDEAGDSEEEQVAEDLLMEEQGEEKDETAADAGSGVRVLEESGNMTQAEGNKGEMDVDPPQEHLTSTDNGQADEVQCSAPTANGGGKDELNDSKEKDRKKDSDVEKVGDTKTKTGAEQEEERERKRALQLISKVKSRVCIPLAYLGPAFDKHSFKYRVRVRPVVLHDFRDARSGIADITATADSVRFLYEHPYKVMELFVSGGRITRLMEKVLYNTFNSNFMTIEVERRRAIKSVKEERHSDRSRAQPTEYAELINRVTFNQKNAYTRRFLQDSDGWIGKSVKQRSLFLHNLPPSMDENFLKILFPRSLKVGLVKVSDDIRSAVLQMKDRNMAYHHLIGFTEFYVDGRDVQMGTVDMSQQDALEKYQKTSPGQVPKSTPKKEFQREAWLQRQRATATSATEAQRKEVKKAFDSLAEKSESKDDGKQRSSPRSSSGRGSEGGKMDKKSSDGTKEARSSSSTKEAGPKEPCRTLELEEKKQKDQEGKKKKTSELEELEKDEEGKGREKQGFEEQDKKDQEREKKESKTEELEEPGAKDGDEKKDGKAPDAGEQEKRDKERKEREKKEREKREHERLEREKKDRERREKEQKERERQRQKIREERDLQKMEESKKVKEQERERERKRKERAQEERLRRQERARWEEQQAREKQRRMHEEQREMERQRELAWQREAELQREMLLQRELEMQREVEKQRELERLRLQELERLRLQELERQKRQQQEKELQNQLLLQEQERQRLAREEAALKLQQMEEEHRRERQREQERERQRKQERERERLRQQQEHKRLEAERREQPAQKRSRFSSPHAERPALGRFSPPTAKHMPVGKGSYDTSFDHDGRDFQASNRQRMDGRDTAMGGDYMFDERDADRTRDRPSWFDRNQTSDQPRIPPPHQGRQHQEEFQGRPPQFRGRNFQRGRGASQGNNQRSPGRPSATMTSGQGLLASPLHAESPNPQNISLQESLQMEVAKQAEELKRNLALLEEFHKDPSRAVANLAKVDPSLASISSVGPREGRGRRGHTHTAPVMGLQHSRDVERKEARQTQQPYSRDLSGSPRAFRQNRSRSGGQGQDYESVFQEYEKELTQQGGPPHPSQDFQQQHQRGVRSDQASFGKGRQDRSSFGRAGRLQQSSFGRAGRAGESSFGRGHFNHEQSGADWPMEGDHSQQAGLLGDPPAAFERGDYHGNSGQQQGQFHRLGVEEKAQLQMVALRQQEQERLLEEGRVQYAGAGMRMEERNMAGGLGFQRHQVMDYEYQGGRSGGARGNRRDYY